MHCSALGFQGNPVRTADLPTDPARTAGVREGKSRLASEQDFLVAGGPTAADCAARPVTPLGGGRRRPSRSVGTGKMAVVLFKLDTSVRGTWLSCPPEPGSESFQRPTPDPGGSSKATAVIYEHRDSGG